MNALNRVNPKTGTLELQSTFPNPQLDLLPGQFGRVRIKTRERANALLVPQRAIQEMQSMRSVLTVGEDNKVVVRSILTGERVDNRLIVEQGLKPGDRVIVEGMQKVRAGVAVKPKLVQLEAAGDEAKEGN